MFQCSLYNALLNRSQRPRLLSILVCILTLTGVLVPYSSVSVQAAGSIYCVATTSSATTSPCTNATTYTTIQEAVAVARSGDEIRIASGTYTGNGPFVVDVQDKSLIFRGGYDTSDWQRPPTAEATIIDGQESRIGISIINFKPSPSQSDVTIERITITGGRSISAGGGISAILFSGAVLTLIDSTVVSNTARISGGGLFVGGGTTVMTRTQVVGNTAGEDGGGFYGLRLAATASRIEGNTATRKGGGIHATYLALQQSRVAANITSVGDGGGIYVGITAGITRTQLLDNRAGGYGGGLYINNTQEVILSSSLLTNNQARDGNAVASMANFQSVTIRLRNVTVAHNSLAPQAAFRLGLTTPSLPIRLTLINTIVASHTVGIARQSSGSISGDYNAFFQNTTDQVVDGNATPLPFPQLFATDPQFLAPQTNQFSLRGTSPLRDAGDPSLDYTNQQDIDGVQLPVGPGADIGAYEYVEPTYHVYLPLCIQ